MKKILILFTIILSLNLLSENIIVEFKIKETIKNMKKTEYILYDNKVLKYNGKKRVLSEKEYNEEINIAKKIYDYESKHYMVELLPDEDVNCLNVNINNQKKNICISGDLYIDYHKDQINYYLEVKDFLKLHSNVKEDFEKIENKIKSVEDDILPDELLNLFLHYKNYNK